MSRDIEALVVTNCSALHLKLKTGMCAVGGVGGGENMKVINENLFPKPSGLTKAQV